MSSANSPRHLTQAAGNIGAKHVALPCAVKNLPSLAREFKLKANRSIRSQPFLLQRKRHTSNHLNLLPFLVA
jgi:hypothetical protein